MKKIFMTLLGLFAILFIFSMASAVDLAWDASADAEGYTIYYHKSSDQNTVWNSGPITATTYTVEDARFHKGVEYTFYVTAWNSEGESAMSDPVKWTRDGTPYTPPGENLPVVVTIPGKVTVTIEVP